MLYRAMTRQASSYQAVALREISFKEISSARMLLVRLTWETSVLAL